MPPYVSHQELTGSPLSGTSDVTCAGGVEAAAPPKIF